jgi:hypothetical protein
VVGILVTRGSRLSIPVGGAMFGIGPDGSLTGSITLHVSYDMYPQWLVQFRNSKQVSNSRPILRKRAISAFPAWTSIAASGQIAEKA